MKLLCRYIIFFLLSLFPVAGCQELDPEHEPDSATLDTETSVGSSEEPTDTTSAGQGTGGEGSDEPSSLGTQGCDGETCDPGLGTDECLPHCDGESCDDGCGGDCDCPEDDVCEEACLPEQTCLGGECLWAVSCEDCPLALRLVSKSGQNGALSRVILALDLRVAEDWDRPRLFDVRIRASSAARLQGATEGLAMTSSGKGLQKDPQTQKTFSALADGTYRLLCVSTSGSHLAPGPLALLDFSVSQARAVEFSIVRSEPIFTPPDVDEALQMSSYDSEIIVRL